jgi:hypothetical protein
MEIVEDRNASEVAAKTPAPDGRWYCDECDANYAARDKLLKHYKEKHGCLSDSEYRQKHGLPPGMGNRRADRSGDAEPPVETKGRAELKATVLGPLRARLRNIDRRIEKVTGELAELREERRDIDFVLKRLDPTSFVAPKNTSGMVGRSPDTEKKALIRRFIEEHADELVDGFTQTSLHEKMTANGITGVVSAVTVRAAIEEMRDIGLVRADKIVKGGGMQWLFVGKNGGKAGEGDAEA